MSNWLLKQMLCLQCFHTVCLESGMA